jgi:hypothetical protein
LFRVYARAPLERSAAPSLYRLSRNLSFPESIETFDASKDFVMPTPGTP